MIDLERLTAGDAFEASVRGLAESLDRPAGEVRAEALSGLNEMAAGHASGPMFAWTRLGRRLLRNYELVVDHDRLRELRALDDDHTLVWLPSHRSYLDTWALPQALDAAGFPHYFVMGGANLDFWPFGDIARRTGIVFIRRTAGEDPVYRMALRQYLAHLVRDHADFGWSIEGGRTRTGKLRPPRYGLLRYLTDSVLEGGEKNVLLVPTSIVWDGLQEVSMMAAEARGQAKRSEDLRWLLDFSRRQSGAAGRVYIDFAEPVPLADRLTELGRADDGGHAVERIALEVCHRINRVTPVTRAALVTLALLGADRALTHDELADAITPLDAYLRHRRVPVAGSADSLWLERTLAELAQADAIVRFDGRERVWGIGPEQHLVAAFYRNSAAHFLVGRAIAELSAGRDDVQAEALRLRELLKFEFFFALREDFLAEQAVESELLAVHDEPRVAHLVLRPFVDAYCALADELERCDDAPIGDRQALLDRALALAQQWHLQQRIVSQESVSLELLKTAHKLAEHRGLIAGGPGAREGRANFRSELFETAKRIRAVGERPEVQETAWPT